jgi:biotin carboxylase
VPRVLLLLPSSTYRAGDFIAAAESLGVELVVASEEEQALADVMGGRSLELPLDRPEEAARIIVSRSRDLPVDGIVAVDDRGVVTAAVAGAQLGLAHNPPGAVRATRDKARQRRILAGEVPQPRFAVVGPDDDVAAAAAEVGLPCVVKPVSLSASRGVIRADTPEDAVSAAKRIRTILDCVDESVDRDGPLLVERFIRGDEVALEGLLRGGELDTLAIFDKPDPLDGPYFEETLYVTPSRLPAALQDRLKEVTATATRTLGLREGPIHAELRVGDDGQVTFLEVAARSIGGLCARSLRFGLGVSLEELILRHAIGADLATLRREPDASGVMMIPIPKAGRLTEVRGIEAARGVDGVVGSEMTVPLGRHVEPLPEGDRYLGFIFARGATPEEVESTLRRAHAELDIVISEDGEGPR